MTLEQAKTTVTFNTGYALTIIEALDKVNTLPNLTTWYEIDRALSRSSTACQHIINLLKNASPPTTPS